MNFLWVLFRLFTVALSMHRAACAAASAGTAGAAADMPACLSVKDQPAYDQSNYDQKDRRNDDGSDICLYPEQHNVSAPFFYLFLTGSCETLCTISMKHRLSQLPDLF